MPGATLKRVPPSDWSPLTALRSVQAIPPRSFEYQTGTVRVCADDSRTKLYVPVEEEKKSDCSVPSVRWTHTGAVHGRAPGVGPPCPSHQVRLPEATCVPHFRST